MHSKIIKIFLVVLLLILSGCASRSINLGVNAYNQGNYDLAAKYWNPLAIQGNFIARYNVGLLWEKGLGSTPLNETKASEWFLLSAKQGYIPAMVRLAKIQKTHDYEDAAISWFNLAARWGDVSAINELQNWGKPVPPADLLANQQYRNAKSKQKALSAAAYQLGRAIGGGGSAGKTSSHSTYSPPASLDNKLQFIYTDKGDCTSDFNCGIGNKCVKAPLKSRGICMKSVDEFGLKNYNLPSTDSVGVNLNLDGQCSFNTDCPIGFKCDRNYKACVKK